MLSKVNDLRLATILLHGITEELIMYIGIGTVLLIIILLILIF